jgi:phosphopantothenoylcysteine decarboxylase/phosphopantothenate--cysteine ligase
MTHSARKFVGELTFEAITRRRVITDQFAPGVNADIEHIALASEIGLLLVAPATANMIGKFAGGIADDSYPSIRHSAPVLIAYHEYRISSTRRPGRHGAAGGPRRKFVIPVRLPCVRLGRQRRLAEPDGIVAAALRLLRTDPQKARRRDRRADAGGPDPSGTPEPIGGRMACLAADAARQAEGC